MSEHDNEQFSDTEKAILPAGESAELTPEQAAGKAAAYNVRINLPGVSDEAFVAQCKERMLSALDVIENHSRDNSDHMDKVLG